MSVLVKGMEMPKSCHNCELSAKVNLEYGNGYFCQMLAEMIANTHERKANCPLIEIPPHGDLIDRDALAKCLGITDMDCYKCAWGNHGFCGRCGDFNYACEAIEEAQIVIEAEEET